MNKEEILAMEAGKELDVLIAEKVMGFTEYKDFPVNAVYTGYTPTSMRAFQPSVWIGAAWEVVENVKERGLRFNLNIASKNSGGVVNGFADVGDWHCNVLGDGTDANHVYAKTAPEAICKAALIAMMDL